MEGLSPSLIRVLNSAADACVTCGHGVSGDVGYYFCGAFGSRGRSCYAGYMVSLLSSRRLDRGGKSDCRVDGLRIRDPISRVLTCLSSQVEGKIPSLVLRLRQ